MVKRVDGGYTVIAVYNEDAQPGFGAQKTAMEGEMKDAYRAFYEEPTIDVREVLVSAQVALMDRFGNESQGPGWTTQMSAAVGMKIQWSNADALDFNDLWETKFKRPDLD